MYMSIYTYIKTIINVGDISGSNSLVVVVSLCCLCMCLCVYVCVCLFRGWLKLV